MKTASAIVGIGQSRYSWDSGKPEAALALEAITAALADAGIPPAKVDGVVRFSEESTYPTEIAELLKLEALRFSADDGNGGAYAPALLAHADAAIARGQARVVVAYRAFNGRSGTRVGRPQGATVSLEDATPKARGPSPIGGEFSGPFGLVSPAQVFALWARAYMHRYGVDESRLSRALEAVVLRQREYANRTSWALYHDRPMSSADYRASPVISDPLRRADICLEGDGACALVIVAGELAGDCSQPPVYILDTAQAIIPGYRQLFLQSPQLPPRIPARTVPDLLSRHGLSPRDIAVAGCYDSASINVICDVEGFGFCEPGEGVDWVLNPTVAVNTSGGHLSEMYLQGMTQILEVVRQLRGASPNQIPDARFGLAGGSGLNAVALLAREPE